MYRASTKLIMLSVRSCSPQLMKIFLTGDAVGAISNTLRARRSAPTSKPACGSVSSMVPVHSPLTSFPR